MKPLVIIMGASSGIGRSTARAFARVGHPLLVISCNIEPLPELDSNKIISEITDVADYEAIENAIRKAEEKYETT